MGPAETRTVLVKDGRGMIFEKNCGDGAILIGREIKGKADGIEILAKCPDGGIGGRIASDDVLGRKDCTKCVLKGEFVIPTEVREPLDVGSIVVGEFAPVDRGGIQSKKRTSEENKRTMKERTKQGGETGNEKSQKKERINPGHMAKKSQGKDYGGKREKEKEEKSTVQTGCISEKHAPATQRKRKTSRKKHDRRNRQGMQKPR
jgi:hypothetical protein